MFDAVLTLTSTRYTAMEKKLKLICYYFRFLL